MSCLQAVTSLKTEYPTVISILEKVDSLKKQDKTKMWPYGIGQARQWTGR